MRKIIKSKPDTITVDQIDVDNMYFGVETTSNNERYFLSALQEYWCLIRPSHNWGFSNEYDTLNDIINHLLTRGTLDIKGCNKPVNIYAFDSEADLFAWLMHED